MSQLQSTHSPSSTQERASQTDESNTQDASQPSQSTSSQPSARKKHANYTDKQRNWMFGLICQARGICNSDVNDLSPRIIRKALELISDNRILVGIESLPTERTLKGIWSNFVSTGSTLRAKKAAGRKPLGLIEPAKYLLQEGHSVRGASQGLSAAGLSISKSTVQNYSKKGFKMRFYRSPQGQVLSLEAIATRYEFAVDMNRLFLRRGLDVNNIFFTDECMIGTGPNSNRQNEGFWRLAGHFDDWLAVLKERRFQGDKVHIFIGLHGKIGVVGPYFIDEIDCPTDTRKSLTATRYEHFLRTKIVPELKARLGRDFDRCWFQQDGAAPHTAALSRGYLREAFEDRVISLKETFVWPPHSPDLSVLDYWFWSSMRQKIGQYDPQNAYEIKMYACKAASEYKVEEVRKAISDFPTRCKALIAAGGHHFERTLKQFKLDLAKRTILCTNCNKEHCGCATCIHGCSEGWSTEEEMELAVELPELVDHMDIEMDE